MTLSIIMPTLGRPTLWASIASVVDQLEDDDRLYVVGDLNGNPREARRIVDDFYPANVTYSVAWHRESTFGNFQRDSGIARAAGRSSHLAFLDDDDQWLPNAADLIRWHVGDDRSHAHIFRAEWGQGHHWRGRLWSEPVFRVGNVGTPMLILPNRPYRASWMDSNDAGIVSDFGWMSAAVGECDGTRWHEDVVAVVRP